MRLSETGYECVTEATHRRQRTPRDRETMPAQRGHGAAGGRESAAPPQTYTHFSLADQTAPSSCSTVERHSHFLAERISTILISFFFHLKIRNNTSPLPPSPDTAVFSTINRTNYNFSFCKSLEFLVKSNKIREKKTFNKVVQI